MQTSSVDVVVIGGGVIGAAAALALSRHDVDVALLEASWLRRPRGSSAGAARIYAPAAFPDESYLHMGLAALERWHEVEAQAGCQLLHPTGCLSFGGFVAEEAAALRSNGVAVEELSAAEARSRFGTQAPENAPVIFQPDAGVIDAGAAHSALLELARAGGVRTLEREEVSAIADHGAGLEVATANGTWACRALVVAAGPWTAGLLAGAGLDMPRLVPTSQTIVFLGAAGRTAGLPAVIDYEGDEPYALWEPGGGLKAAFHTFGPQVDPTDVLPAPDADVAARVADWANDLYPDMDLHLDRTETCIYTNAPEERFVFERRGAVVIASACNGQGFQFAPESGEQAAGLALEALGIAAAEANL